MNSPLKKIDEEFDPFSSGEFVQGKVHSHSVTETHSVNFILFKDYTA